MDATDAAEPPHQVDVSVLIPVLDEARHIVASVAAMRAQRFDGTFELLFADGGSSDGTREILERLSAEDARVRVFDNPRRRTPSGLNVCLRHARGEYVARMDAHTFYPPTYLATGVRRLRRGDTSWVSGPAIPQPVGSTSRAVALALATWLGQGGSNKWKEAAEGLGQGELELDTGVFAGVWRRERVLEAGGWDEGWASNQDAEMAGRFLGAGERLVCLPEMGAHYVPRDRLRGLARQYYGYGFYRVRTALRHPHSMRRSHVLAPGLVVAFTASVAGPRALRRPARIGVGAYLVAVLGTSARFLRRDAEAAVRMPAVFLAIHCGNGIGFLRGFARFGVPWVALAQISGLAGPRRSERAGADEVHAPSLHEGR